MKYSNYFAHVHIYTHSKAKIILADFYRKELFRRYSREVQPKKCKVARKTSEKNLQHLHSPAIPWITALISKLSSSNFSLGDTEEETKTFIKSKLQQVLQSSQNSDISVVPRKHLQGSGS